jgi:hypothetical protein
MTVPGENSAGFGKKKKDGIILRESGRIRYRPKDDFS